MTVSVSYLSKNCTTCLFISKSFKELFFMAFFSKADAKVRTIFELPKLFRSFFSKSFFLKRKFISSSLFQNFNLYRISLDCGCKGRAFIITHQMHETLFLQSFRNLLRKSLIYKRCRRAYFLKHKSNPSHTSYLIIFARTRTRKNYFITPTTSTLNQTAKKRTFGRIKGLSYLYPLFH